MRVYPKGTSDGRALGGSQNLPGRSRVVDFHPQFFDRYQSLILEPLVGHTSLGRQRAHASPGAFACKAHGMATPGWVPSLSRLRILVQA